jgi:hypothetical protein
MAGREVPLSQRAEQPAQTAAAPVTVQHAVMRYAPGIVHAVCPDRPEHGVLTYTPGQALPGWIIEQLEAGAPLLPEAEGVFTLGPVPARTSKPAGRRVPRKEET